MNIARESIEVATPGFGSLVQKFLTCKFLKLTVSDLTLTNNLSGMRKGLRFPILASWQFSPFKWYRF